MFSWSFINICAAAWAKGGYVVGCVMTPVGAKDACFLGAVLTRARTLARTCAHLCRCLGRGSYVLLLLRYLFSCPLTPRAWETSNYCI